MLSLELVVSILGDNWESSVNGKVRIENFFKEYGSEKGNNGWFLTIALTVWLIKGAKLISIYGQHIIRRCYSIRLGILVESELTFYILFLNDTALFYTNSPCELLIHYKY